MIFVWWKQSQSHAVDRTRPAIPDPKTRLREFEEHPQSVERKRHERHTMRELKGSVKALFRVMSDDLQIVPFPYRNPNKLKTTKT